MPAFETPDSTKSIVFFILRNSVPAGLLYAERIDETSLFIDLDFVIPGYRDLKIGKYVYSNIFSYTGVSKLYSLPGNTKHENYLRKMGFMQTTLDSKQAYYLNNA